MARRADVIPTEGFLAEVERFAAAAERARGRDAIGRSVVRHFPGRPRHLRRGHTLVLVVNDGAIAAHAVDRPAAAGIPDDQATERFAQEIAALGALLGDTPGLMAPASQGDLTAQEIAIFRESGIDPLAPPPAPADDPVVQSRAAFIQLIASSLTVEQAAKRLGVQTSRIRQRLGGPTPTLYGFKVRGSWRLPVVQFNGRTTIPGLEIVAPALPRDLHPLGLVDWFALPDPDLEPDNIDRPLSPRDWLLGGYPPETVAELARGLGHLP